MGVAYVSNSHLLAVLGFKLLTPFHQPLRQGGGGGVCWQGGNFIAFC